MKYQGLKFAELRRISGFFRRLKKEQEKKDAKRTSQMQFGTFTAHQRWATPV